MAQRRLPALTHQLSICEQLEALEEEKDVLKPLTCAVEGWNMSSMIPTHNDNKDISYQAPLYRLRQRDIRNPLTPADTSTNDQGLESNASIRGSDDAWDVKSTLLDSGMLSKHNSGGYVGSYSSMESNEPLLLDSSTSTGDHSAQCIYSNGGIQMNISVCDDSNEAAAADRSDKLLQESTRSPLKSESAPSTSKLVTSPTSRYAGTNITNHAVTHSPVVTRVTSSSPKPSNLGITNQQNLPALSAVRNRQKFWNNRSVSTDVPSTSKRDTAISSLDSPNLSKLVSISGPLLRVNSFERGTQTIPFQRLNTEQKSQARYESTISDIGVEYMKATGVIAPKFKQLQKPNLQSHDSVSDSVRNLNYDPSADGDDTKPKICSNQQYSEVPTVVHMTGKTTVNQPNYVIKLDNGEGDDLQNKRHTIGYRLGKRKLLAERRRKIADMCCICALLGLLLMIVETECNIASVYAKSDVPSYVLKSLISASTLVLLGLICTYHAVEVKLFVVDNCIEDWRIAMSWPRIVQIGVELFLCLIHPVPIPYSFDWTILDIKSLEYRTASVPIDVLLSLPMFSRLYLIIRVMLLHSKLFSDASSRSIGALNKITFNTRFVLKTLMTIFPGTVMGVFMLSLWIICAWTFRACESYHDPLFANFLNTLYMVAITFLSVGYGDFVPHTHCGRAISVVSGLMGAGCTALVVAVIARKLELTRAEKHVHNFMLETQLNKKLRNTAANVLRETWLIHKYTKPKHNLDDPPVSPRKIRAHQRKFLQAIQTLRIVKMKQRKLNDQANSLTDYAKTTSQVHDIVSDLRSSQQSNNMRIENIEVTLQHLQMQVQALPHSIAQAMLEKQLSTSSFASAHDISLHPSPSCERRRSTAGAT